MNTHALKFFSASLLAAALALPGAPAFAQHEGHTMPMPAPRPTPKPAPKKPAPKPAATKPVAKPAPKPAVRTKAAPAVVDHAAMGHGTPAPKPKAKPVPKPAARPEAAPVVDHAAMGHGTPAPKPQAKPAPKPAPKRAAARPAAKKPGAVTKPVVDHAAMGHGAAPAPAAIDHAAMGHGTPAPKVQEVDHAAMGHGAPTRPLTETLVDHAAMGHGTPASEPAAADHAAMGHGTPASAQPMDHGGMDHAAMGHGADPDLPADAAPRTPIPALTDADRAAAFPTDAHGHEVHDQRAFSYWLVDRLEWQDTEEGSLGWEGLAWIGGDVNRVWLRTEGEASEGEIESANAEVLYGRALTPWWDAVAGVRHDFGHGPSRTYAAFGVQGLAPYKFEVEATGFIGANGRGGATLEAEYDTLITNRLILQWQGETTLHAKDDPEIGVGSGLSTIEAGARLRYELTRRFAPYVGVEFERAFGGTADLRREHGEPTRDTRLVAGIRFWF